MIDKMSYTVRVMKDMMVDSVLTCDSLSRVEQYVQMIVPKLLAEGQCMLTITIEISK